VDDKLDEHECVFFEARLLVDEAFFHRVAPYVRVWLRDGEDPTARRLRLVRPDLYAAIKAFPIREFAILDDAEAAVLAAYWGGSMTEEEMTALENRMSDDQAFFARIAPKLMIFFMRLPPEFIEAGAEFKLGKVH
jgi:hypothetical protein